MRQFESRCAPWPAVVLSAGLVALPAATLAQTPTYADVAPVMGKHCVVCHNGAAAPLGLRLDTLEGVRKGSSNGAVAKPGDVAGSELVRRIRGTSQPRMPLTGPPFLSEDEVAVVEGWIAAGMPAGQDAAASTPVPAPRLPGPGEPVTYSDVAPIFLQRCVKCHSDNGIRKRPPEGLRLGTREQILGGGERVAVIPGLPTASEVVRRITGTARPRMPHDGPPWLTSEEVRVISDWITQGAPDDDGRKAPLPVGAEVRMRGRLTGIWAIDGVPFRVDGGTRLKKRPAVGDNAEVRAVVAQDGSLVATRVRRR